MNYRHAFHAGNFADVFKHAAFALILEYLKRKAAPFAVVDTHAGLGRYDLAAAEAERTGEWRDGIGRVLESFVGPPIGGTAHLPGLASLLEAIAAANGGKKPTATNPPRWYPGSPRIARTLIRKRDRLWCAELHPDDARVLACEFRGDLQVIVRHMDGYEAIRAWLPPSSPRANRHADRRAFTRRGESIEAVGIRPPMRRGVVLVDPPFEQRDEFKFLLKGLKDGHRRFATGIFVLWYPIKDLGPVKAFHKALAQSGIRRILAAELLIRTPVDPDHLNGCGLIVVNPPWRLDSDLVALVAGLRIVFSETDGSAIRAGEAKAVRWLVGE